MKESESPQKPATPDAVSEAPGWKAAPLSRIRIALSSAKLVAGESIRTFQRNHAFETAATLSFYALLSAIPLLLLSVFVLSRAVLTSQDAMDAVEAVSARLSPDLGRALMTEVRTLADQRIWTGIGLLALFWLVTPFAATWRAAFDRTFAATQTRSLLRAKAKDLLGTLALWVLFLLVVLGKIAEGMMRSRFHVELTPLAESLNFFLSPGVVFLGLLVFYLVFEPVRPRFGSLAAGAVTATVLLFALRPGFSAFLRFNPNYGFAFGSLKAVFVMIMWSYWCFAALLFGAEITANIRRRDAVVLRALLDPVGKPASSATLVNRFVCLPEPRALIFNQGDSGHSMYVVRTGEVELTRAGRRIQTVRAGGYFGEMAILTDARRTATARAGPHGAELVEIARNHFDLIVRENPRIVEAMLREFARRLRPESQEPEDVSKEAPCREEERPVSSGI